jgi:hypothetical protein
MQSSSKAVMFVLINLSICLLTIIDIFTYLNKFVSGSCITFIVNLTYCILPNELKFETTHIYCIIISICPLCRGSILLFFHLYCMLKYWDIKSFVTIKNGHLDLFYYFSMETYKFLWWYKIQEWQEYHMWCVAMLN